MQPAASQSIIEARGLTKHFRSVHAVKSVHFDVNRGEVFGFFGPNGAGKTTTIRLLCGLTSPTSGTATVCGVDVKTNPTDVRRQLGILQEEEVYYEKMTPAAYLRFFARMAGHTKESARDRMTSAVEISEIGGYIDKRISTLSHGQRQKISIGRTLLSTGPVQFLDEPFSGIDIVHRKSLRAHFRKFVADGNTVFFTSHNLIEAEQFVDRFAFIDKGTVLKIGTARELRDQYLLPSYAVRSSDPAKAYKVLSDGLAAAECVLKGDEVVVTLRDAAEVPKIAALLGSAGIALLEMRPLGTMEDVFLKMRAGGRT
jgi:ABC-type multidrug transport system ATPase subunit